MIATVTTGGTMTADEFIAKFGDESGIEFVHGQIVKTAMPSLIHGEIAGNAFGLFRDFVRPRKLGRMYTCDSFVRTIAGIRGADVMFISYETLPFDVESPNHEITPPLELIVEVKSSSQSFGEMTAKAQEYLDSGVKVVLVLDPETESLGVFRVNEFPQRFHNGDLLTLPDILPGFSTPVKAFFER